MWSSCWTYPDCSASMWLPTCCESSVSSHFSLTLTIALHTISIVNCLPSTVYCLFDPDSSLSCDMTRVHLHGGLVLPLDGQHDGFDPGLVVFENDEIVYVGPAEKAPEPTDGAIIHECPDRIILPGLVNTHTHIGMSLFRNLLEDLPSSEW